MPNRRKPVAATKKLKRTNSRKIPVVAISPKQHKYKTKLRRMPNKMLSNRKERRLSIQLSL
jgi:hypothetical protein